MRASRKPLAIFVAAILASSSTGALVANSPAELDAALDQQLRAWGDLQKELKKRRDLTVADTADGVVLTGVVDAYRVNDSRFKAEFSSNGVLQRLEIDLNPADTSKRRLRDGQWGSKFADTGRGNKPVDWLPAWFESKADQILIDRIIVPFENGRPTDAALSFKLGSAFTPIDGLPLSVGQPSFNLVVTQPGVKNSPMRGELLGSLTVGAITGNVKGSVGSQSEARALTLEAALDETSLGDLISTVSGGSSLLASVIPQPLLALAQKELRVTINPRDKKVSGVSRSSIGESEFSAARDGSFRFGARPPQDLKLASIHPALGFIDAFGLKNTGVIVANQPSDNDMQLFQQFGNLSLEPGLTIMGAYDFAAASPEAARFFGVNNVVFTGNVPPDFRGINLQAAIETPNITLIPPLSGRDPLISLRNARIKVAADPAGFAMGLAAVLDAQAGKDTLSFETDMAIDLVAGSVAVSGYLDQVNGNKTALWENPFGIAKGLALRDLGLLMGVNVKGPIPLPVVGFQGSMVLGDLSRPLFQGTATVGIDPYAPQNSVIDAAIARLALGDLIRVGLDAQILNNVPREVLDVANQISLEDVRLTVVPSPTGTELFGKRYDPGFLVQGRTNIAGFGGELFVGLDYTKGVEAQLRLNPINNEFFRLTGARGNPDPMLTMILKASDEARIAVSGLVAVPPLGLEAETDILVFKDGFDAFLGGKIFGGAFQADVEVAGGDLKNGGTLWAKANMKDDFFRYMAENASREIAVATQDMQNQISKAQSDVTTARNNINRLDADFNRVENQLKADRQRSCTSIRDGDRDVAAARNQVNLAQQQVNNVMNDPGVVNARRDLDNAKRNVETARAAVNNINNDPNVQRHFADLQNAQRSLSAAQQAVNNIQNDPGVVRARQDLDVANRDLENARRAVNSITQAPGVLKAQRDLDAAQAEVSRLDRSIADANRRLAAAEREMSTPVVGWVTGGGKSAVIAAELAGLNTAKGTANLALNAARVVLNESIEAARQSANGGITVAQRSVDASRSVYDGALQAARATANAGLQAAQGTVNAADRGYQIALEGARQTANQGLNIANGTLNASQQTYDGALRAAQQVASQGLNVATGTLRASENAARFAFDGCMAVPIEQALLAPIRAEKAVAVELMNGSNLFLEGVKQAGTGTMIAADFIVRNGPLGVVKMEEAEFETCLNAASGGNIRMNFKGSFANRPVQGGFDVNFANPTASVKFLADAFLNGNVPGRGGLQGSCQKPSFAGKDGVRPAPRQLSIEQVSLVPRQPADLVGDAPKADNGGASD